MVTSKGKELFHQAAAGVEQLHRPEPAQAQRRTGAADGDGVRRRRASTNRPRRSKSCRSRSPRRPTDAALYASLAEYAYKAKNIRVGDLASEKAVSLSPAAERTRVKNELAEVKANPSGEKTYTTTTNGKTYAGKLNAKGELKATEVKTTPASTGTSTPTKKKSRPARPRLR